MSGSLAYAYAVSRIRSLERELLDRAFIQRLSESADLPSALKLLGETAYSAWLVELKNSEDYEFILTSSLRHTFRVIDEVAPEKYLPRILRLAYDFHNVKVLLKNKLQSLMYPDKPKRWELLLDMGNIPTDFLVARLELEEYHLLDYSLHGLIPMLLGEMDRTRDPGFIDKMIEKACFAEQLKLASNSQDAFIVKYIKRLIDIYNLKTAVRMKRRSAEKQYLEPYLASGGAIDSNTILEIYGEPYDGWSRRLFFTDFVPMIDAMGSTSNEGESYQLFERMLDDSLISWVWKGHYVAFGSEPIIAYVLAKQVEIKNLRVVLVGKENKVPVEDLRGRLRNVYQV